MYIAIAGFHVCDIMNYEINFLIKPFFYMTKKPKQE